MEPKDLKNSNEELNSTPQEPENVEKQEEKTEVEETPIVDEKVEKSAPKVTEEKTPSEEKEEVVAEVTTEEPAEEVAKEEKATEPALEAPEAKETPTAEEATKEATETVAEKKEETPVESKEKTETAEVKAEEEKVVKQPKRETVDYTGKSEVELINTLRELLEEDHDYYDIKEDVDNIKLNFYKLHQATLTEQKEKFYAEHDKEEEFIPAENPYEVDLKNLLDKYRQMRVEHNKKQEEEKEENLKLKYQIIEDIKALINNDESINKTFQEFRELQNNWRDIGLVPQSKLKDLWETYHHHVENFYDYIKINKELRDLDLKKNLEAKINLCEKAEELLVEPSVIKAFNILQKYHEQWREIGPVPRDKKDELWERFKAATSKINKKHQEYFEDRKTEQKKNLEAKTLLCEKAEEISELTLNSHSEWDAKSKELIELQKVWRTIGFAPKKDNNAIYDRFRNACDKFFNAKREFYSQNKEVQQNNLQLKTDLCIQAESIKDSTDWKKTTDEFIKIQKKWKEIGTVPRKQSDIIWKRFRAACDFFFDKKSEHFSSVDTEQLDNLKAKQELIDAVKNYELTGDESVDLDKMKEFQRTFTEIGHVPFKDKDRIQNDFRDAINVHFDSLRIDEKKRNLLKFRNKVANMNTTNKGHNKMRFEREKYMTKLKQLENDLALLDNNIGFFANTKNAESLIGDVNDKIEATKQKIEFLKQKIRIIDASEEEAENE